MSNDKIEFSLEYEYRTSLDAEERLAEAYDLVISLILEELENSNQDGERCSTPSE